MDHMVRVFMEIERLSWRYGPVSFMITGIDGDGVVVSWRVDGVEHSVWTSILHGYQELADQLQAKVSS